MTAPTSSTRGRFSVGLTLAAVVSVVLMGCSSSESGSAGAAGGSERLVVTADNAASLAAERVLTTTAAGLSLDWSPDGEQLAVADDDRVFLIDGRSFFPERPLGGRLANVWTVRFSPNGKLLASAGDNGSTIVWNLRTRRRVRVLEASHRTVLALAWSPNGRLIASGGDDGLVRVWSLATGRLIQTFDYGGVVLGLAWSPVDASQLAVGGGLGTVVLVDPRSGEPSETVAPSSAELPGGHVNGIDWDASGEFLAASNQDGSVRVYRRESATRLAHLEEHEGWTRGVSYSPNGALLATGGSDGTVFIWNTATWRPVGVLSRHASAVWSVAWSPDGSMLATAGGDKRLRIWTVR